MRAEPTVYREAERPVLGIRGAPEVDADQQPRRGLQRGIEPEVERGRQSGPAELGQEIGQPEPRRGDVEDRDEAAEPRRLPERDGQERVAHHEPDQEQHVHRVPERVVRGDLRAQERPRGLVRGGVRAPPAVERRQGQRLLSGFGEAPKEESPGIPRPRARTPRGGATRRRRARPPDRGRGARDSPRPGRCRRDGARPRSARRSRAADRRRAGGRSASGSSPRRRPSTPPRSGRSGGRISSRTRRFPKVPDGALERRVALERPVGLLGVWQDRGERLAPPSPEKTPRRFERPRAPREELVGQPVRLARERRRADERGSRTRPPRPPFPRACAP
jgi:hypothetical protein